MATKIIEKTTMTVEELEEIEVEFQDLFDAFENEDPSLIK